MWRAPALLLCALFLASVARFYHPGAGFTALILFHQNQYYQLPALREIPHYEYRRSSRTTASITRSSQWSRCCGILKSIALSILRRIVHGG